MKPKQLEQINYDEISPGIRDLVRELREVHFMETVDSGDGTNLDGGMDCALPHRHVFMQVSIDSMIAETVALADAYPEAHVECNWSPGEPACIMIWPDGAPMDNNIPPLESYD